MMELMTTISELLKSSVDTCGGGLELWTSSDLVAYGVCSYCDMGVGSQPIILVKTTEH